MLDLSPNSSPNHLFSLLNYANWVVLATVILEALRYFK